MYYLCAVVLVVPVFWLIFAQRRRQAPAPAVTLAQRRRQAPAPAVSDACKRTAGAGARRSPPGRAPGGSAELLD